jgi:hypothetical protein
MAAIQTSAGLSGTAVHVISLCYRGGFGFRAFSQLRRAGIDALVRALGAMGMARFLQQFDPGHGDYTADRDRILGNPTVDDLMDGLEHRRQRLPGT